MNFYKKILLFQVHDTKHKKSYCFRCMTQKNLPFQPGDTKKAFPADNRVEAATPPSAHRPARVRRKTENTLRGPCHKKGCPPPEKRGTARVILYFFIARDPERALSLSQISLRTNQDRDLLRAAAQPPDQLGWRLMIRRYPVLPWRSGPSRSRRCWRLQRSCLPCRTSWKRHRCCDRC